MLDEIKTANQGFRRKFPKGNTPFQIMTRLLEECGELAQQVNHFEGSGVKRLKHGEPDRTKLAQEVKGVLLASFQIVDYYDIQSELESSIGHTLSNLRADGFLQS